VQPAPRAHASPDAFDPYTPEGVKPAPPARQAHRRPGRRRRRRPPRPRRPSSGSRAVRLERGARAQALDEVPLQWRARSRRRSCGLVRRRARPRPARRAASRRSAVDVQRQVPARRVDAHLPERVARRRGLDSRCSGWRPTWRLRRSANRQKTCPASSPRITGFSRRRCAYTLVDLAEQEAERVDEVHAGLVDQQARVVAEERLARQVRIRPQPSPIRIRKCRCVNSPTIPRAACA
jgi:hypothetical protein